MTIRVGMVGTGWFGKVHADILAKMEGVELAAVTGTSREKAEAFASGFSGTKGYAEVTDMLDGERLDAVYLCVPPFAHGTLEEQLIERGIPFLVEKPLDTGIEGPRRITARLRERPVITSAGYHLRYRPSVQQLKSELQGGTLGIANGGWMGGFVNNSWWPKQELSGGQFIEQTTHLVDLLRFAAGEAREVYAVYEQRAMHRQYDTDVPDVGSVTIRLQSGALANLSNTCLLPDGVFQTGIAFYTDQGLWDWNMERLERTLPGGKKTVSSDEGNPYAAENEAFIHAVRTGDTSRILSDYADALRTQEITVAALESARTGRAVTLG